MVQKFPPPPQLPKELGALGQQLNRWLIEVQSILNAGGTVDPTQVSGLVAAYASIALLITEVATNTANIAANTASIGVLNGEVTTLQGQVTTLQGQVTALNAAVTALQARNQILNGAGAPGAGLGNNGDLYINNTGAAGSNLYAKIGGAWVAFA